MELHHTIFKFLKVSGIDASKNYLKERLKSHPAYPSLTSITDILDEFKIENYAFEIEEKEKWKELDFPFLAHVISPGKGEGFEIIKKKNQITSINDFLKRWTGIALMLGDQKVIHHEEHSRQYKKEKYNRYLTISISLFFVLAFIGSQTLVFQIPILVHFSLSLVGLIISGSIISYGLGIKTKISDTFCRVEEEGCSAVLNSKLARFGGDIGLGDIAAIFFGSLFIYQFFSHQFSFYENFMFLIIPSTLAFGFTFISIIYQFYLGSWCKLCLIITAIIWVQAANMIIGLDGFQFVFADIFQLPFTIYLTFGISLLLVSTWVIVKPVLISSRVALDHRIRIRKWRQDPAWFDALLPLHKKIDDTSWSKEIFYGNPHGVLQIIIVSDPYCESCATAHMQLDKILNKHPNDIGVRIRFTLNSYDPNDRKHHALIKILNAYEHLVWKKDLPNTDPLSKAIITDWFQGQNLKTWEEKYNFPPTNSDLINQMIHTSLQWSNAMEVTQTPAFFINGFEMPNPHTFRDMFLFISDYIDILRSKQYQNYVSQ